MGSKASTWKRQACAGLGAVIALGAIDSARGQTQVVANASSAEARLAGPDEITVSATRQERRLDEVPATVSVIDSVEIEDQLATDIKDIVQFEPGVSVRSAPSRFTAAGASTGRDGNAGFNIRGLEGNRVLIQVDGIRLPDAFSFGAQAVGRGDYVDLDILKSVEILRGPASALYGSDGLAGAVSFTTKDPEDFFKGERSFALRGRAGYSSADRSFAGGAAGALRLGDVSGLIAYTFRTGHETQTQGDNRSPNATRTAANPQDIDTHSALAKLVYEPAPGHRLRLTGEHYDREIVTEVFSARAAPPLGSTSVIDLDADDETRRSRLSLDWRYEGEGLVERAFAALYYQTSETTEFADEDRNAALDRIRRNLFDNRVLGLTAQAESDAAFLGLAHSFVFGADASTTRQQGLRDGVVPPTGEFFPAKAFPDTDYVLGGLFLQDEIGLLDGKLKIIPAIRYDFYELSPEADPVFVGSTAGQSDGKVSPKVGFVYWATENFGAFANAAKGFKAPLPSQVNNGFTNVVINYRAIPNPGLEPETSKTIEGGLRMRDLSIFGGAWSGQVAAFAGKYEDFIEQIQVGGTFTPVDPAIFQFVNLSEVTISGVEARLDAAWANGLGATVAASATRGDQQTGAVKSPLNSIDPWKLLGGLSYRDPNGRFGGRGTATHSAGKNDARVDQTVCGAPGCFTPEAFTIVDATAYLNLGEHAAIRLGVFNIADVKYSWWSDVRGLASSSTVLDAYTQPGRTASVSLTLQY